MALVGGADREIDQLFGERIQSAGSHDLFDAVPGAHSVVGWLASAFQKLLIQSVLRAFMMSS